MNIFNLGLGEFPDTVPREVSCGPKLKINMEESAKSKNQ
jgi:hypothetical protein